MAKEKTDREKVLWFANRAAEDGDPDLLAIACAALDGDEDCFRDVLELMQEPVWQRRLEED